MADSSFRSFRRDPPPRENERCQRDGLSDPLAELARLIGQGVRAGRRSVPRVCQDDAGEARAGFRVRLGVGQRKRRLRGEQAREWLRRPSSRVGFLAARRGLRKRAGAAQAELRPRFVLQRGAWGVWLNTPEVMFRVTSNPRRNRALNRSRSSRPRLGQLSSRSRRSAARRIRAVLCRRLCRRRI